MYSPFSSMWSVIAFRIETGGSSIFLMIRISPNLNLKDLNAFEQFFACCGMNEGIFLDLMAKVLRGDKIRIYPIASDSDSGIKTRAYPCQVGLGEIYIVTEPFVAKMEAYNDVALRVRTDNDLCLIINVEEIRAVERIW